MNLLRSTLLAATAALLCTSLAHAQATESAIKQQLKIYRSIPAAQRPPIFMRLAADIRALPAGPDKVGLADDLVNEVTEGDNGLSTLQAAGDTLNSALVESPLAAKDGAPPAPYISLAKIVRYMHVTATSNDPLFARALQTLADEDAAVEKQDFTLDDLDGNKVTLSKLRGKVVVVNFWATWCPPCRLEMPDLDALYTRLQPRGLVVLAVTADDAAKVKAFMAKNDYHLPVLLDPGREVSKRFYVEGIPKTYVFNPEGKLAGVAIDQTGERQFLALLAAAGLRF